MNSSPRFSGLVALLLALPMSLSALAGELELVVTDAATGVPVPVRVHLRDQRGRTIIPRGHVGYRDHFVQEGKTLLKVGNGVYQFEMERGPEYLTRYGNFDMQRGAADNHAVEMKRFVDMTTHQWYAGDLHVHRRAHDMELLMLAEELYFAALLQSPAKIKTSEWPETANGFDQQRFYDQRTQRDARAGGSLIYLNLDRPLDLTEASSEYPSLLRVAQETRRANPHVHITAASLASWDLPVWAAYGVLDSVMLLNEHQQREGVTDHEAGGKPRNRTFFPGAVGHGRYVHDIYYHLLNCGFRLPPAAGSGSGEVANPLGYNRVYVHTQGEAFSEQAWLDGLRAGRVMVTNGPLLIPKANGEIPGHVFSLEAGEELQVEVALQLFLKDKVDYLEVVKNGSTVHEVRLADLAKNRGRLPPLKFEKSGWFLVRAVTGNTKTYRMATTGPYYVEVGYQRRISKKSAQFFLDWVFERARRLKLADPQQHSEVLAEHRTARDFFQALVNKANAE